MRKPLMSLLVFSLAFGFYSCQKDESTASGSIPHLKTIISKWYDSLGYSHFFYDSENRLITIVDNNNNGHRWSTTIEYNNLGNPIRVNRIHTTIYNTPGVINSFSFVYDDKNRISKKLVSNTNNVIVARNSYTYNSNGKLLADTGYSIWNNEMMGYTTYAYNSNGNVTQEKIYEKILGAFKLQKTIQFSYDNKPNSLYQQGLLYYLMRGDDFYLSKNNRTQTKYPDGTIVNYDYEYNDKNLPKRITETENTDPSITYLEFFYE